MISKKQINNWYDQGQKSQPVNMAMPPNTNPWDAFIIWGIDSDFMSRNPISTEKEEEARSWAKEQGLM